MNGTRCGLDYFSAIKEEPIRAQKSVWHSQDKTKSNLDAFTQPYRRRRVTWIILATDEGESEFKES